GCRRYETPSVNLGQQHAEDRPPRSQRSAREGGSEVSTPAPIRVLVVDDQELVRSGFCVILDAADGITVVGEAANGEAAVAAVAALEPAVGIRDSGMPGMEGVEAPRQPPSRAPAARSAASGPAPPPSASSGPATPPSASSGPATPPKVVMLTTFDLDEY